MGYQPETYLQALEEAIVAERANQSAEEEDRSRFLRNLLFERDRVLEIEQRMTRIEAFLL
jgi:hypothetical protein